MPERHHWAVRRFSGSSRCESWGCPDADTFETIYVYQHEGEAQATRKTKRVCYRHAQGWAQAHGIAFPYERPEPPPLPSDPINRDTELEPTSQRQRYQLIWSRRRF